MASVRTAVRKWGNSVAVRIPKPLAEKLRFEDGREVTVTEDGSGGLRIRRTAQADESLESLLSRITTKNSHALVEWGALVGGEAW